MKFLFFLYDIVFNSDGGICLLMIKTSHQCTCFLFLFSCICIHRISSFLDRSYFFPSWYLYSFPDGEMTIDDKYKKTLDEIEALKDHLGAYNCSMSLHAGRAHTLFSCLLIFWHLTWPCKSDKVFDNKQSQ